MYDFLMLLFIVVFKICPLIQEHFLCSPLLKCKALLVSKYKFHVVQLSPKFPAADPGGGLRGLQTALWEVFKLVWLSMSIPFSCQK